MSKKNMTKKDKQDVLYKLDWEGGFEYLVNGSDFPEYTDPEFRKLVDNFVELYKALEKFLGTLEVREEEE